ncbi:MAG: hypothetical protein IKN75_08740 [Prevotella sp.]|nr:hypothetical protein [Prevotella sp.]
MTEKELFAQKAQDGYMVCYAGECPLREQCLRWKVGQQMPDSKSFYTVVNPRSKGVGTTECPHYRDSKKVTFATGMMHIFNDDMPSRVVNTVKTGIIRSCCKTYYYEYRKGERLIPPALQEEVRALFREAGWNEKVEFDGYVEDYDW